MIDLEDMQAQTRMIPVPIFRRLTWHLNPRNMPIIRRLFDGWQERDAEYMRSGEPPEQGGA
jgi:hypothetical protein